MQNHIITCSVDVSRPHYGVADYNPLVAWRRTITRIKPTSAVKAFGFSVLAAYPPPPRYAPNSRFSSFA